MRKSGCRRGLGGEGLLLLLLLLLLLMLMLDLLLDLLLLKLELELELNLDLELLTWRYGILDIRCRGRGLCNRRMGMCRCIFGLSCWW